jgi:hypothetical protein
MGTIMASNGLRDRAKKGTCRVCFRTRSTEKHVKAVGEVRHGYATGHIWECADEKECDGVALERIKKNHMKKEYIKVSLTRGRIKEYMYVA